ncbi:MAG TPA: hypothetical protein VFI25_08430 [Planctomycetota bacterium]|nr:hypothetical protein [Planctomycetota bacterium]
MSSSPAIPRGEAGRLAVLTLLAIAAIVLVFHVRLRGGIAREESRASAVESGAAARFVEPSGRATGARPPVSFAERWSAPAPAVPDLPGRWVALGTRVPAETPDEGEVLPPLGLRGDVDERGVTVRWLHNDRNPREGVSYEVYRWRDAESVRSLGGETAGLELVDREVCPSTRYFYCVVTVVRSQVEGVEVRRSRRSEAVGALVGERYRIEVLGVPEGRASLRATGADTGRTFETFASPGDTIRTDSGEPTGFVLEEIGSIPREEDVELRLPVFRPDGSREVEDGRPVFRSRTVVRSVSYPSVRYRDACGVVRTAIAGSPSPRR